MITELEKIILGSDFVDVRRLWIVKIKSSKSDIDFAKQAMDADGFEQVDVCHGALMTDDGREVLFAHGQYWALRPEIHRLRVSTAIEKAVESKIKSVGAGESMSSVLCPKCKSVMAKSPVCPGCDKGIAGFKILCTCTECLHEVYL